MTAPDERWEASAACASVDPSIFHPTTMAVTRLAVAVCKGCPVTAECMAAAVRDEDWWGIRGGLTGDERYRLVNGPGRVSVSAKVGQFTRVLTPHGTPSARRRHRIEGEPYCATCAQPISGTAS